MDKLDSDIYEYQASFTRHGKVAVAVHGKVAVKIAYIVAYESIYM